MKEQEREAFLEQFQSENGKRTLVGFCVMGGIFGEGIDLKGDALIGTVIVGTGLPQVCYEREILKDYYQERGEDGFAYDGHEQGSSGCLLVISLKMQE